MSVVLVIDSDRSRRRSTVTALRYGGYETATTGSVKDAGRLLRRRSYAGIVIDPGVGSASAQIVDLRGRTEAPIIVVSAVGERGHVIACLESGADDYLTIPFDPEELLARFHAVLRRTVPIEDEPPVVTDDFTVDIAQRSVVRRDGTDVRLSPIEWMLVETLVRHADHLVTREDLLAAVWGPDAAEKTQYLRVHMASIRQKLEPDHARPRYFLTAPGLGLKFVANARPVAAEG